MTEPITQNPNTFYIDECRRSAIATVQWMAERDHKTHPITANNTLEVLVCGQEAFERIAKDIEAAQDSIDLVCWGFDPGMELVRGGGKDAAKDGKDGAKAWPRGQPYGSLLHAAASRGVKVRLLVWHNHMGGVVQNNLIGYTGDQREGYLMDSPSTTREDAAAARKRIEPAVFGRDDGLSPEQHRHDYCVGWWRDVRASTKTGSAYSIEVLMRKGPSEAVQRSLAGEDRPSAAAPSHGGLVTEKSLLEGHATHHQKTLLIDYAYEGGAKAVGYVMGLNSVTDYWDTDQHLFDTPLRETDWACKSETAQALKGRRAISRDPYQDYASRIAGPALQAVQQNFVRAWQRAAGKLLPSDGAAVPPKLKEAAWPGTRIQVVRTQPEEGDKTIKNAYWQATSFARNYLYLENQYFFYESWVRHLKAMRQSFMQWIQEEGRSRESCKLLHLLAVIPRPEDDGMIPRTYDTVKSLGEAASLPGQNRAMRDEGDARQEWAAYQAERERIANQHRAQRSDPSYELARLPRPKSQPPRPDPVYDSAAQVQEPTKNHKTGELEGLGLKVLLARLVTHNDGKPLPKPEQNYRQIYIHSKLMLIDDAFFTLGSANMNLRSMAVDSEINMATDDHFKAKALRQRVWSMHGGGFKKADGGDGSPAEIEKAFEDWKEVMDQNKKAMKPNAPLTGFLIPFEDKRVIHFRHG